VTAVADQREANEFRPKAWTGRDWVWIAGLSVVLAVLYAWQLQPGIAPHGDISKFQFAGPLGGTAHQTGYPLYLMLGWLAAHAGPFVGPGTAVTTLSALFSVGAAVATYTALRELMTRPIIAAAFSLLLGVAPVVFYYAVVAEVYAAHLFLMATLLAMLLRWRRTGSGVDLAIAIVLLALSFTHHMGTALLIPGILWFVWKTDRSTYRRPGVWLLGVGSLAVAVLLYGYLIWRAGDPGTPFVEVAPESWSDLPAIWIGTGGASLVVGDVISFLERLPRLGWTVIGSALLALPFAVVGFRALRRDAAGALLILWGAATALFAVVYAAPDPQSFIVPVVFVLFVAGGVGAERIAADDAVSTRFAAVALVVIGALAIVGGVRFVGVQSHADYAARTESWITALPPNSVLAASYTDAMAAFHLSLLEGTRTDVVTISDYPIDDPNGSLIGRYLAGEAIEVPHARIVLEPGRPVYAPGQGWACELAGAGFGIERYDEHLFRVLPLADQPLDANELCGAAR